MSHYFFALLHLNCKFKVEIKLCDFLLFCKTCFHGISSFFRRFFPALELGKRGDFLTEMLRTMPRSFKTALSGNFFIFSNQDCIFTWVCWCGCSAIPADPFLSPFSVRRFAKSGNRNGSKVRKHRTWKSAKQTQAALRLSHPADWKISHSP